MRIGDDVSVIAGVRIGASGGAVPPFGIEGPVDVFLTDGRIADIAPAGTLRPPGPVLDAHGGWLIPGLWDHHVHATQWALESERTALGAATTAAEAARLMGESSAREGRRIGSGYRDALWPDTPSLEILDAVTGAVPTYLINADVHSVWMNSAAFRLHDMSPTVDGVVREAPAFELSRRLNEADPAAADESVDRALRAAATRGVVGIVDLEMTWNMESWRRRLRGGFDAVRISAGIYPRDLERAVARGLQTGDVVDAELDPRGLVTVGPLKVVTDGSLGTRTAACSHAYASDASAFGDLTVAPASLRELMSRAARSGLHCAIHAIGDVANAHALDAYAQTGAQGTIEHAQLVAHADLARFARLGVGASVQPRHAVDDRAIAESEWSGQTSLAYPLASLARAGATLLFGSDAPAAPLDPWATMAAAVFRTLDDSDPWRSSEAVDVATALRASQAGGSTGDADAVSPGRTADLVVCEADPMTASAAALREMRVTATLVAGRLTHVG